MGENIKRSVEQFRQGRPIILYDDMDREYEGDLAFPSQYCTPELVNLALTIGRGLLCAVITPETATRIGIGRLESNNRDPFGTPFGMPISLANGGTGISAEARCETIRATCRPDASPSDFCTPGHVATLIAHPGGLAARGGHTEAILSLLSISGVEGGGVLCEILNADGTIARRDSLLSLSHTHDLPMLNIGEIVEFLKQ